jgi:hypothetical protein
VSGSICTVSWRALRKWNESRVVLEHHYDYQQSGDLLSDGDLRPNVREAPTGFHRREYPIGRQAKPGGGRQWLIPVAGR